MVKLDHIAFLVGDLDAARAGLERLDLDPGFEFEEPQTFESEGTLEAYAGPLLFIQPIGDGPYADAHAARGPGLHHLALHVDDMGAFMRRVEGSGWLMHPRSYETSRAAKTVWLARPGVEVLIEVHESGSVRAGEVDYVVVAGLDSRTGLDSIFEGLDVRPGPRSGVVLGGEFIGSPEALSGAGRDLSDTYEYNRGAWNRNVAEGNKWTVGVGPEEVSKARAGAVEILLTPTKFVPQAWLGGLGALEGKDVLGLASGGGQQGPLLAAAGANVTIFDASDAQLDRDREVAEREGLQIRCVQGDMRDLSEFADDSFDLIVHPCSNCFVAEIRPVWREAARVLRPGGELLSGFNNPVAYCFDWGSVERGTPTLRHRLPYRDIDNLEAPFVFKALAAGDPVEFSHTLEDQIGGQIEAGFSIVGFYTDPWGNGGFPDPYFDGFVATRAKLRDSRSYPSDQASTSTTS